MTCDRKPTPYPSAPSKRVLLVDDNSEVLQDLRYLLELASEIEVIGEANNGQEAIQLTQRLAPDMVVMDLEMPVMNGFEATRQIKSKPCPPRVIILSIHAGPIEHEKARAAGADGFLAKGCSYEDLLNTIQVLSKSID